MAVLLPGPCIPPLSVWIEKLPELPGATPMVINRKNASLHEKPSAIAPVTPTAPAEIEASLPEPGVSISDTLYTRPIPARVSSPLLATGEFRRFSEVRDKPEMVRMRVPKYLRPAREQNLSGWVMVMPFVDEEGKVVDTAAVESSESFNDYDTPVAEELRGSIFTPGKLDGRAVKTLTFVKVGFNSKAISGSETAPSSTAPVSVEGQAKP